MKLKRCRTYMELRVGASVVEVVFYIRSADLAWFNSDDDDDGGGTTPTAAGSPSSSPTPVDRGAEVCRLLEESVIPREMEEMVETDFYRYHSGMKRPPKLGPGAIPMFAGDQHYKKKRNNNNNSKRGGKKGKAKKAAAVEEAGGEEEGRKHKPERDFYYAFGQTLQLMYKFEDVPDRKGRSATLVFRTDNESTQKRSSSKSRGESGIMQELRRLPKRIVAWIFPYNPSRPNAADPTDGGFPIPERIPIAHLFRSAGREKEEDK